MNKTNAMRMLDRAKIEYTALEYSYDDNDLSGTTIAKSVGLECLIAIRAGSSCSTEVSIEYGHGVVLSLAQLNLYLCR